MKTIISIEQINGQSVSIVASRTGYRAVASNGKAIAECNNLKNLYAWIKIKNNKTRPLVVIAE